MLMAMRDGNNTMTATQVCRAIGRGSTGEQHVRTQLWRLHNIYGLVNGTIKGHRASFTLTDAGRATAEQLAGWQAGS